MIQKPKEFYKKVAVACASIVATVAVYNSWFLNLGIRTAGDWGFFLKVTSDTLRRFYFSIWLSDNQFGRVLIDAGQAPTYAAYGWLSHYFNLDYAINERLIHLWPAVIVALCGSYFLTKYIFNDRLAALLGMLIYSANTYYLALLTGGLTLAVAYAFAPLVILLYLKVLDKQTLSSVILCALVFAVCGAYEPRTAYIVAFLLAVLAFVHFFFMWLPKNRLTLPSAIKMISVYSGPFVIFILLNVYWILGLAHAGGTGNTVIATSLFGNEFFNIGEALTLFHPFWTGNQIEPFFMHAIPVYFWLIPAAAIIGLALNRNKKDPRLFYFAIVGIIGILLCKQSDEPFPGLYQWLFNHMPGFNAFREASKFYLLVALSYAILIPSLYWYIKNYYQSKLLNIVLFIGLALLFLPNLIPIATNTIGATFEQRSMPQAYVQLNSFLDKSPYGRILWVPQKSRWSLSSANHPSINATDLLSDSWRDLLGSYNSVNNATTTDEINALFQQGYMATMLSRGAIKYVVVPMRDLGNDDNFYRSYNDDPSMFTQILSKVSYLKEANIHINGFKVYEAVSPPKPYFSAADTLYSVDNSQELPSAYSLWQKNLNSFKDFNFVLGSQTANYITNIRDLFGSYTATDLKKGKLPLTSAATPASATHYFDQNYSSLSYKASSDSVAFTRTSLPVPGQASSQQQTSTIASLQTAKDYILDTGASIMHIARDDVATDLGSTRASTTLYSIDSPNILPMPDATTDLWQQNVEDCAPYGNSKPAIGMQSILADKLNIPVLTLTAKDHAACTGPQEVSVHPGKYLLHFRYRGAGTQFVSYRIIYGTGDQNTVTKDIPVSDSDWHGYDAIIEVPDGVTKARLLLIGRPSNQLATTAMISYTDVSLNQLGLATELPMTNENIQKVDTSSTQLQNSEYQLYPSNNLIPNSSFESGLWKKQVDDCDAYDNGPELSMSRTEQTASSGKYSLQLEAKRHIACTDTGWIKVDGAATYLLQFDYQSPNAHNAEFTVASDDSNAPKINQQIPITDSNWHTYRQIITVTPGTHRLNLAIAANSEDQLQYYINRYDNFTLQRVPDLLNRFYAVSHPQVDMAVPQQVTFQNVDNTLKTVAIHGASKPFILLMSEQYDPGWQLVLAKLSQIQGVDAYLPWVKQPTLASSLHSKVNDFENAWYIDPQVLCATYPTACHKNADSSYDINLVAQFSAQRWFNFGMLVSGGTGVLCIGVLINICLRKRRSVTHKRQGIVHGSQKTNR